MRSNNAVVAEQRMCQNRSSSVMLANVSYVTCFAEDRLPNYRQVTKSRLRSHEQRLAFDQECKSFVQVENRLLPKIVRHINN
jgi:hypothetical protein